MLGGDASVRDASHVGWSNNGCEANTWPPAAIYMGQI